ncbi:unannotated protein [freshwater metagenome]|uniref:Unannotated protein n=1 Tax=freshwater metagenome TaxID=449393 RepID=A0A6J6A3Q9_9ZZZZ
MFHHDAGHVGRRHVGSCKTVGIDLALAAFAVVILPREQQFAHVFRAHATTEVLTKAVWRTKATLKFTEESLVSDQLLRLELVFLFRTVGVGAERPLFALGRRIVRRLDLVCEQLPNLTQTHPLIVVVSLGVVDVGGQSLCQIGDLLLALVGRELLDVDVETVRPDEILIAEVGL